MCIEKIKFKKAKLLIIAEDTSQNTKDKINRVCEENKIKLYEYGKKDEISYAIGKQNKTVVAILDNNFAKNLEKLIIDLKGAIS